MSERAVLLWQPSDCIDLFVTDYTFCVILENKYGDDEYWYIGWLIVVALTNRVLELYLEDSIDVVANRAFVDPRLGEVANDVVD